MYRIKKFIWYKILRKNTSPLNLIENSFCGYILFGREREAKYNKMRNSLIGNGKVMDKL